MICNNGSRHEHTTVEEARICWRAGSAPVAPAAPVPPQPPVPPAAAPIAGPPRPATRPGMATDAQRAYVRRLGGDDAQAALMSIGECSRYIKILLNRGSASTSAPAPRPTSVRPTKVPLSLLDAVPGGYYAVRSDATRPYTFLRLTRPNRGTYKDATKVQTKHADRLSEAKFVVWPSGQVSIYEASIEDALLLLICDYMGAARAYAKAYKRCCRCNIELTDERSRHYSIGPDCEEVWPWMISYVDDEHDGKTYEALKARGELIDV